MVDTNGKTHLLLESVQWTLFTHLFLIKQHCNFEQKNIVDHNLFILVEDLKSFATDDIILD